MSGFADKATRFTGLALLQALVEEDGEAPMRNLIDCAEIDGVSAVLRALRRDELVEVGTTRAGEKAFRITADGKAVIMEALEETGEAPSWWTEPF